MLSLLRQRNFALLWWGGLISMMGDWMLRIAMPAFIYQRTGSTLATGAMFIAGQLPSLLLGTVAGVFVDRWDRQRTMVITNLLLLVGLLPLVLVTSNDWLWIVYVVAFVQSCTNQFFGPAENALLPQLVGEEHLLTANSLNSLNNNLARLIGPALGGFLALSIGLAGVAILDALTFLIAAGMIALIRFTPPERVETETASDIKQALVKFWDQWASGLRLVKQEPMLRLLFTIAALWAIGEGIMAVLFVPFVTNVLHGQATEVGWLMSAQAVGGLTGGVVIAKLGERVPPIKMFGPATILFGLIDLIIFNYSLFVPGFLPGIVLFILVGIPAAGVGASFMTFLQNSTTDVYRGRIFGAYTTTFSLLTLMSMGFASTFGDVIGIREVINVQGFAYVIAGILGLTVLPRIKMPKLTQEAPTSTPLVQEVA